jgi:CoA:oxalate CoA-transferase
MNASSDPRFLEGIRVLDFTQYLAGPSSTRMMAELGAEIIKVEQPPFGDPMRGQAPRRNRRSGSFIQQNRGKLGLCLDLSRHEAVELVKELIPKVDVVVENFTPGVMARRGLDYESLAAINPGIVMASVSGFGQTGSWSGQSSFDFIAQAYAGIMHVTGDPEGPPMFVGTGMADTNAGVHAFAGIGYALFQRTRTGKGCHIDISMVDALFHMHENNVQAHSLTDGAYQPMRRGRHYDPVAPAGSFQGPEGWIVVLCSVNQIENLWKALGRPELADDPRFANNTLRIENRDALTDIIEEWMAGFDSDQAVMDALLAARVPCGPVLSPADAIGHQYFIEREMIRLIDDPFAGEFHTPGFPIKFSSTKPVEDLVAPTLGQHNRAVLSELLGCDDAAIDAWEADGLLGSKDR